jgi:single-strand DNA-binding protein
MVMGNLGADPEMRFAPSGKPVTTFRVAVNNKYKDSNGVSKEETEWFSIVAWGKTAELCNQYLQKGSLVFVEGRNKTRSWDDNGQKRYRTEVVANRVLFLDKPNGKPVEPAEEGEITPDDIPF